MSSAPVKSRAARRAGLSRTNASKSLAANVQANALWAMATTVLLRLSNIGLTAVVAHILTPRDFGIFAVALTVFTIVSAIGEFGVVSCLIRADLDVDALAPTLCAVSWGSSVVMAGLIYLFAEPIAAVLGAAGAANPVRVMALVVLIWGVSAVPTAQCIRDFKQNKLFLANLLAFVPSTVILLLLGLHGQGAMAFAWSRVAGQLVSCVVMIVAAPTFYLPGLTRSALRVLYRFGLPIAAANCISYFLSNVDYVFIGHLAGPVLLGIYVLAFNAASWSTSLLGGVLTGVSTTSYSRVKGDTARLMDAMADGVHAVMLIAAPMCMLVLVLARPVILTLYGWRWAAAVPVLRILCVYGLIAILGMLFASMLTALGKPKSVLAIQLVWLFALFPAMAIGVHEGGIVGAAVAHIVIICPIVLPCYLVAIKRATGIRLTVLAKAATGPLVASVQAACVAWLAAGLFTSPSLQAVAGMGLGGACYLWLTAPQLVQVIGRGRAPHPLVSRILSTYEELGQGYLNA
jgi:PST family polysaccharide transporter